MNETRHFITGQELTPDELRALVERAGELKHSSASADSVLRGSMVALLFDRPSTRTRVSFEVAATQLGGGALILKSEELQLARGETVRDTAMVMSRYVQALVAR